MAVAKSRNRLVQNRVHPAFIMSNLPERELSDLLGLLCIRMTVITAASRRRPLISRTLACPGFNSSKYIDPEPIPPGRSTSRSFGRLSSLL